MGTFPQFFANLGKMTFEDKSVFWIGCGLILLIVLVYMFSPKLRKVLQKIKLLWIVALLIPVLILGFSVWSVVRANEWVPLNERSAENLITYDWENVSNKGNKVTVTYISEIDDPQTGTPYEVKFQKIEAKKNFGEDANLTEAYTVTDKAETGELTFNPDGTYRFHALEANLEETGQYAYIADQLILASNKGIEASLWKNINEWMTNNQSLVIMIGIAFLLIILIFIFNRQIHAFLKKHPLVWLIIPAFLLFYFVYVAIGWNVWVSVSDWPDGQIMPTYNWGGFGQYAKMFDETHGPNFWNAVKNTLLLFTIIPICLLLGLAIALVMDHGLRGTSVFRTLILLPFALSFVVTGAIWQQMYRGDKGIILKFFGMFGIDTSKVLWLNPELVMLSVMIVMVWQFSGYVAVIFLAAIKNVPTNVINAAKLDGAYMPRIYWKLVIPQLKGAMGSCITILAMYALRSFDLIVSLKNENFTASQTLPVLMYFEGFSQNNYAYAAAISCFLLALVLVLILPLTYLTNRRK